MASGARWPLTRYYRGFIINWLPINARHSTYTCLQRFIGNDLSARRHRWIRDATHLHRDPSSIVNERQRPWRSAAIRVFPAIFSSDFPAGICSTFEQKSVMFHYCLSFSVGPSDLLFILPPQSWDQEILNEPDHRHHGYFVKPPEPFKSELGKEAEETIDLCSSCSFQRGDRVSNPRAGEGANPVVFPLQTTTSSKTAFSEVFHCISPHKFLTIVDNCQPMGVI